ncbi:DUF2024 family protein [Flavobacterium zepuense]|uniref:DUF2024 family protein n=1 Tax=Flavobacterium zepuense TaxID=2593302 RepID=A0A552UX56_9FLAO|nr:DUF2024 family protein [Flavobacterium zepuense]TRW22821.1 DUF2024 family protein [Flavobacterium zepuense]
MKVAVWDTYITKKDGSEMHFDILAPDEITDLETIYSFGKDYLATKQQESSTLSAQECNFCHMERATPAIEEAIVAKGYYIIEMEGC